MPLPSLSISPLSLSLREQIQYALTHVLIEPREFCQAIHLCSRAMSGAAWSQVPPLLQAVEQVVRKARATAEGRMMVENRERRASAAYSPAGVDQFGKYAESASTAFETRYGKVHRPRGDAPSVVAQSDTLRILQISDIHPDLDYSEVSLG